MANRYERPKKESSSSPVHEKIIDPTRPRTGKKRRIPSKDVTTVGASRVRNPVRQKRRSSAGRSRKAA